MLGTCYELKKYKFSGSLPSLVLILEWKNRMETNIEKIKLNFKEWLKLTDKSYNLMESSSWWPRCSPLRYLRRYRKIRKLISILKTVADHHLIARIWIKGPIALKMKFYWNKQLIMLSWYNLEKKQSCFLESCQEHISSLSDSISWLRNTRSIPTKATRKMVLFCF